MMNLYKIFESVITKNIAYGLLETLYYKNYLFDTILFIF